MLYGRKPIGTVGYLGGVPANLEAFTWAWGQLIQYNALYLCREGQRVHYIRSKHSFHSIARNQLANDAIGKWLLMLDIDHTFEPDVCVRLLRFMNIFNLDVLSAMYFHKDPPHIPIMFKHDEENKAMRNIGVWDKGVKVVKVDSTGGGTLLVRTEVFRRIRKELKEEPFDIIAPYGEDHSFALRLQKLGIDTWCSPVVESGHLKVSEITSKNYDASVLDKMGAFTSCETIGYQ